VSGVTLLGPVSSASATTTPASVKTILSSGDLYVNDIRTFFFCTTATCKKNELTNEKLAYDGVVALADEVKAAVSAKVGAPYAATINQMQQDASLLDAAYAAALKDKTAQLFSADEGVIYYTTAELASETYVLGTEAGKAKLSFRGWDVGDSAALYVVQVESQTLAAKNVTASQAAFASACLEGGARELSRHVDSPSKAYNALIAQFAANQLAVSTSEILILEGKKAPLSVKQVSARTVVLAHEFKAIVALQASLDKA
jgi:uncharacterized protein YggU (UPF0235/DUF167 family)